MEAIYLYIHETFAKSPEFAVFLSLAAGFWIGKFRVGSFQLGGVAGSLLAAVLFSQFGVNVNSIVKSALFALFIYAVGFDSGPRFFRSLGRHSIREIFLALTVAASGLITVVVMAKVFNIDKGMAAGLLAGGMTQSAIIGVAGDALSKLGLSATALQAMQANVAIGYAVTYMFGSLGVIIFCSTILPKLFGHTLREDAIAVEAETSQGVAMLEEGQELAVEDLVGRTYKVRVNGFKTVNELENAAAGTARVAVEGVKRGKDILPVTGVLELLPGDFVLVVGKRSAVVAIAGRIGQAVNNIAGLELTMQKMSVVVSNEEIAGKSFLELMKKARETRQGAFVLSLARGGTTLPLTESLTVENGDVMTIYGTEKEAKRLAVKLGYAVTVNNKTDFVYMGAGLVIGLLIGLINIKIGSIPVTLGSGGGVLLSGLFFGWYHSRHQSFGNLPAGASQMLRDFGLAGFVAVVGLDSGLQAVSTVKDQGISIFLIGVVVTTMPLIIGALVGRYALGYKNVAVLAGALAGSRSSNPALGEVLNAAGNSVPTGSFAVTYALANVFLTMLGIFVVALV